MCIDADWETDEHYTGEPMPKEMEVVTVRTTYTHDDGLLYYGLDEYQGYFEASAFVPISEINETDMIREYNTQTT